MALTERISYLIINFIYNIILSIIIMAINYNELPTYIANFLNEYFITIYKVILAIGILSTIVFIGLYLYQFLKNNLLHAVESYYIRIFENLIKLIIPITLYLVDSKLMLLESSLYPFKSTLILYIFVIWSILIIFDCILILNYNNK